MPSLQQLNRAPRRDAPSETKDSILRARDEQIRSRLAVIEDIYRDNGIQALTMLVDTFSIERVSRWFRNLAAMHGYDVTIARRQP